MCVCVCVCEYIYILIYIPTYIHKFYANIHIYINARVCKARKKKKNIYEIQSFE